MTLRNRVGLTGGAAVLLALVAVSLVLYPALAANLHDQLDSSLVNTAAQGPDIAQQVKQKNKAGVQTPISTPLSVGTTVVQILTAPVTPGDGLGFVPLRVPKMFNLRTDPYERADTTSNSYYDWVLDHAWIMVPMQAHVAQMLQTFAQFPPRQKPASFSLEQVLAKLEAGLPNA